ncbi:MAG TPA: hypothetical protein VFM34_12670 [Moraxellaceae bacterium]|nr:hypothetical protein [Moraxellaceae bacterium]
MILLSLAVLVGAFLVVLPVWLAAKLFGAQRSGFFICLLASFLSSLAFHVVSSRLGLFSGFLLGVAAMAVVYQLLLKMGFWSGVGVAFAVALLQALVYGIVLVLLAGLLGLAVPREAHEGLIQMHSAAGTLLQM